MKLETTVNNPDLNPHCLSPIEQHVGLILTCSSIANFSFSTISALSGLRVRQSGLKNVCRQDEIPVFRGASTALFNDIAKALVETCCAVLASAWYFWYKDDSSLVFRSTSLRAFSSGDISATSTPTTSDRRRTVGNVSSVVKYVFSSQISSVPSLAIFLTCLEELNRFMALEARIRHGITDVHSITQTCVHNMFVLQGEHLGQ